VKLNWAERWVVNNPLRVLQQRLEMRWLRRAHGLRPGSRVLEIGCGRGAGAAIIEREFLPATLLASDLDPAMLERAARYLAARGRPRVPLIAADATALPFPDGSFDAVFDFGAVHHVPEWRRVLAETARVLRPGGAFYFEELFPSLYQNAVTRHILLHPAHDRFRSADLREALDRAGLAVQRWREWPGVGVLGVSLKGTAEGGPPPSRSPGRSTP
jgi:ubiquinone/menaquinone biosynthesis C-methylase UbiE